MRKKDFVEECLLVDGDRIQKFHYRYQKDDYKDNGLFEGTLTVIFTNGSYEDLYEVAYEDWESLKRLNNKEEFYLDILRRRY